MQVLRPHSSGHSSRLCGDADLGVALGVAVLRRGEGSKGSSCKEQSCVPRLSQCQDVPAWEAYGNEVQELASSLPTSSMAAAGHCSFLASQEDDELTLIASPSRASEGPDLCMW